MFAEARLKPCWAWKKDVASKGGRADGEIGDSGLDDSGSADAIVSWDL